MDKGGLLLSTQMDDKAREAKREYMREWQKKNRDKVRAAQARYWMKKAAEMEATKKGESK